MTVLEVFVWTLAGIRMSWMGNATYDVWGEIVTLDPSREVRHIARLLIYDELPDWAWGESGLNPGIRRWTEDERTSYSDVLVTLERIIDRVRLADTTRHHLRDVLNYSVTT